MNEPRTIEQENKMAIPLSNQFNKSINEALIGGERVRYDGCDISDLETAKNLFGEEFEYIGSGFTTFHNGVRKDWKTRHHFFVRKIKKVLPDAVQSFTVMDFS